MGYTQEAGSRAERMAAEWLMDNGFELRHMNWRNGRHEIDIVASRGDTLHFVEVKYRRAGSLTKPEDAITNAKFASLCRAAEKYIAQYRVELEIQFDLIAVESLDDVSSVRYVPNAMIPRW